MRLLYFTIFLLFCKVNIIAQPRIKGQTYVQCATYEYGNRQNMDVLANRIFICTMPNGKLGYNLEPGKDGALILFLDLMGSNNGWYMYSDFYERNELVMTDPKLCTWVYINRDNSRVRVAKWFSHDPDAYIEYRVWKAEDSLHLGPTK